MAHNVGSVVPPPSCLDSDDVLVIEKEAFYVWDMPRWLPLKRHHYSVRWWHNYSIAYISKTAYHIHLGPSPFDLAPGTLRDMKFSFLSEFPL